jgi:hypothetical protein
MLFDAFLSGGFLWLLVEFAHFHLSETVGNIVVLRIAEADLSHPEVFYGPQEQQQLTSFPGVPYGLKLKPITTRNPQANAIIERVHQTIGNIIRTFSNGPR